ncbi:MAG: glutaredoxin domain-containing protein [Candidatus Micrarchaeia archaeon]
MSETDPEIERIKAMKMLQMRMGITPEKNSVRVQVYSTQTCPYCHMAKDYLKANGVSFEDIDVGNNQVAARYMAESTGQTGVPQINIGGQWVMGFDRRKIDLLLSL